MLEKLSGDELHQRIETLKIRRRNDRIHKILFSAAKGDLNGMKEALKVCWFMEIIRMLLKWHELWQHENVNVSDALKRTPLHVAASEGQARMLYAETYLMTGLSVFSNFHFEDHFPFWRSVYMYCCAMQLEIVKYLIDNGSDVNAEDKFKNTCLNDAVRHK